jgi:hypothetical protein
MPVLHPLRKVRFCSVRRISDVKADISEQSFVTSTRSRRFSSRSKEAQAVIGLWQNTNNRMRPRSSFDHRPPAPVMEPDLAFRLPMAATMQRPLCWPSAKYRSGEHDAPNSSNALLWKM